MNREEEERQGMQYSTQYGDFKHSRAFLDRDRPNHPPRNSDETRSSRRSPERREDGEPGRESKRKRE